MFRPFIRPRTRNLLQNYVRRGFATILDLDDPPVTITFTRVNHDTGATTTFTSTEVVMRTEAPGVLMPNAEGYSEYAYTSGLLRHFAPWGVQVGDTFTTPDGRAAKITAVPA